MKKGLAIEIIFLFLFSTLAPMSIGYNFKTAYNETEYWALLVGVGIYADNPDYNLPEILEYVDDLYDVLIESPYWQASHIKVIKGEDATVGNIINGLHWLDKMDDDNDISLVYITTHGGPLKIDIPPLDEADGYDEALMSFWGFSYPMAFIWDDQLNFYLNRLESKGVCLIIDSCYAGGFNDTIHYNNKFSKNILSYNMEKPDLSSIWSAGFIEDVRGKGRVILMACREDEVTYSGYFSSFIIDGLKGYADSNMDGIVTAEELFFYVEPRTALLLPSHSIMFDDFLGELPLLSVIPPNLKSFDDSEKKFNNIKIEIQGNNNLYIFSASENPLVCGYVYDEMNGEPIRNAHVILDGEDYQGNYYEKEAYTNISGFYKINAKAGYIRLLFEANSYFWNQSDLYEIGEEGTLWLNCSLYPIPIERSIICGYINDIMTSNPIIGAEVYVEWNDDLGHHYSNATTTDYLGFYCCNVAAGEIHVYVQADGYFHASSGSIIID